jgi:hypothetical protein
MSLEKETPLQGDEESPERYGNGQLDPNFEDDAHVQCPPHTTERKLMTKVNRTNKDPFIGLIVLTSN